MDADHVEELYHTARVDAKVRSRHQLFIRYVLVHRHLIALLASLRGLLHLEFFVSYLEIVQVLDCLLCRTLVEVLEKCIALVLYGVLGIFDQIELL